MKIFKEKKNKGFTMLFAVLVSVLVLSVGASIITLALKQIRLSGSARDSQFAFYAANTGLECAEYWDWQFSPDGSMIFRSPLEEAEYTGDEDNVTCVGNMIMDTSSDPEQWQYPADGVIGVTRFWIKFEESDPLIPYCAQVTVTKTRNISNPELIDTKIDSRGYNTCDLDNSRRIERGLETNY